jgi:mannose/fructose-specific phosphotransferase system component IIA
MRALIFVSDTNLASSLYEAAMAYYPIGLPVFCMDKSHVLDFSKLQDYEEWVVLADDANSNASLKVLEIMEKRKGSYLYLSNANVAMAVAALTFYNATDTLDELKETLLAQAKSGMQGYTGKGEENDAKRT